MQNAGAVIREAGLVAAAGLIFAFGANALSPRGLDWRHMPDFVGSSANGPSNALDTAAARAGFPTVSGEELARLFQDARAIAGVVFVDARDDEHYRNSHIPGARQLDPYHPDAYLPAALPACLGAQKVIVYCNGSACEDSVAAAAILRDAGVPAVGIFVYSGGIADWMQRKMPVTNNPPASEAPDVGASASKP